jgi:crotonobetainyl-CoA:carnitine CoA-transferase CaiB-like acyl-CoA transferase
LGGPLQGVRIIELGSFIAGPFATRILADFGAEVIKVESLEGDQLRQWGMAPEGTSDSYWSMIQQRNKKSVAVNLRSTEGQQIVRDLLRTADAVVENFKPGTLEKWNLSHEEMRRINPRLIITSVSGFGQTGPYRDRPGFGNIAESMGGWRYITGYPDRPPVRIGLSLGDSVAALYAVIGTLLALYHRDVGKSQEGQTIDVALYEAVFSLMEGILPEYVHEGRVRERSGNQPAALAPSNVYRTADGKFVAIGANSDSLFKRMMTAIGREDLAQDPELQDNPGRVKRANELDQVIQSWTMRHSMQEIVERLERAGVPAGPIYSIADIYADPHYRAREMFVPVPDERVGELVMPGIVPKMSETPGTIRHAGPPCGFDTLHVLKDLGYDEEQIDAWEKQGIIGKFEYKQRSEVQQ